MNTTSRIITRQLEVADGNAGKVVERLECQVLRQLNVVEDRSQRLKTQFRGGDGPCELRIVKDARREISEGARVGNGQVSFRRIVGDPNES